VTVQTVTDTDHCHLTELAFKVQSLHLHWRWVYMVITRKCLMIFVTKSYLPKKEKLLHYIDQIYSSHQLTNYGPLTQLLEQKLASFLGVRNIVLVSNGTLALQIAYKALNLSGSAITTPFSFPATTSTLVWESIRPIFADINPHSWNISPTEIEKNIQPDTSAIVPTHVFGNACEVEAIQKISQRHNLKVIYDGAHAFGVQYKNKSLLNWGDATTLSFHATKLFHTIEGGAIITNDDTLAEKIRLMINFGIISEGKIVELGINAKFNEFQAAMGLCILDEINNIRDGRKKAWDYYFDLLKNDFTLQARNSFSTNNHGYFPVLFESSYKMLSAQRKLNDQGIFPRRYFYPSLNELPYIHLQKNMPQAKDIANRVLCLPLYVDLSLNTIDKIVDIINIYSSSKNTCDSI